MRQPTKLISPIITHFLETNKCRDFSGIEGEKSALVTLNFPTANRQQSYYFNSQTLLDGDNCTITAIEIISNSTLSVVPNGQSNFPIYANQILGVLYISDLNRQIIAEIPLSSLNRSFNSGKPCFTHFKTHVWQNCYVEFMGANFTQPNEPLVFQIWYVPKIKE
jgi:hypothetical protein